VSTATYREPVTWQPERPRFRLARVVTAWILAALALMAAAWLVPGASIEGFWGALLVSAIVAALNAVLPPILAALKLPFTLVAGFLLGLAVVRSGPRPGTGPSPGARWWRPGGRGVVPDDGPTRPAPTPWERESDVA